MIYFATINSAHAPLPLWTGRYFVAEAINLERLRELDPAAISAAHKRFYGELYRYAAYRLGDAALAEDLASDVFLRLLDALQQEKGPLQNLRGWLYGTLSNLINDQFRRSYRQPKVGLSEALEDPQPEPSEDMEQREALRAVAKAMRGLTPEQQHVLSLRFGAQLSIQETARLMDKKANAIKALQFRALRALRAALREDL
jgi:RNA polymerase sigma-70 factor (ECF subfamily)